HEYVGGSMYAEPKLGPYTPASESVASIVAAMRTLAPSRPVLLCQTGACFQVPPRTPPQQEQVAYEQVRSATSAARVAWGQETARALDAAWAEGFVWSDPGETYNWKAAGTYHYELTREEWRAIASATDSRAVTPPTRTVPGRP